MFWRLLPMKHMAELVMHHYPPTPPPRPLQSLHRAPPARRVWVVPLGVCRQPATAAGNCLAQGHALLWGPHPVRGHSRDII